MTFDPSSKADREKLRRSLYRANTPGSDFLSSRCLPLLDHIDALEKRIAKQSKALIEARFAMVKMLCDAYGYDPPVTSAPEDSVLGAYRVAIEMIEATLASASPDPVKRDEVEG